MMKTIIVVKVNCPPPCQMESIDPVQDIQLSDLGHIREETEQFTHLATKDTSNSR